MPTLKGVKVIRSWSGQLDMCWDGSPVISPVEEVEGLYVGCAFTGHGFGIGPAAGYVLAQMAVGEALPPICPACGMTVPAAQPLEIESAASSRPEVHRKGMDL